jgi:hypothetical protein
MANDDFGTLLRLRPEGDSPDSVVLSRHDTTAAEIAETGTWRGFIPNGISTLIMAFSHNCRLPP